MQLNRLDVQKSPLLERRGYYNTTLLHCETTMQNMVVLDKSGDDFVENYSFCIREGSPITGELGRRLSKISKTDFGNVANMFVARFPLVFKNKQDLLDSLKRLVLWRDALSHSRLVSSPPTETLLYTPKTDKKFAEVESALKGYYANCGVDTIEIDNKTFDNILADIQRVDDECFFK